MFYLFKTDSGLVFYNFMSDFKSIEYYTQKGLQNFSRLTNHPKEKPHVKYLWRLDINVHNERKEEKNNY